MGTREVLVGRLTDKCPNFCGLTDRLPNRSPNVFRTQNFWYPIDTTNTGQSAFTDHGSSHGPRSKGSAEAVPASCSVTTDSSFGSGTDARRSRAANVTSEYSVLLVKMRNTCYKPICLGGTFYPGEVCWPCSRSPRQLVTQTLQQADRYSA